MIDFTNFTLRGQYYTAVYMYDDEKFMFNAELTPLDGESMASVIVPRYLVEEMGKELIELAAKADSLIDHSRKEPVYDKVI